MSFIVLYMWSKDVVRHATSCLKMLLVVLHVGLKMSLVVLHVGLKMSLVVLHVGLKMSLIVLHVSLKMSLVVLHVGLKMSFQYFPSSFAVRFGAASFLCIHRFRGKISYFFWFFKYLFLHKLVQGYRIRSRITPRLRLQFHQKSCGSGTMSILTIFFPYRFSCLPDYFISQIVRLTLTWQ
jgi:hypothetical protein